MSLAICADIVRVLDETGVRLRDLPVLSGVSKEAISMGMGILTKHHLAVLEPDPSAPRGKIARLTPKGILAQELYVRVVSAIEKQWEERFGNAEVAALRASLEKLAGDGTPENSPLFTGLTPYPENWRAAVRKPQTLPHYPMVLHRGGYPDGS